MTLTFGTGAHPAALTRRHIGDHRITYLPDGVAYLEPRTWLPDADDQVWSEHSHLMNADGYLIGSVGALLIEHGNRAMLIDAGAGPMAVPTPFGLLRGGQLPYSLATIGISTADIELIALTHLHLDHIGWLWQSQPQQTKPFLAGMPVLVSDSEWDHSELVHHTGAAPDIPDIFADRIHPLSWDEEIFPGVTAFRAPGHSVGHTGFVIESKAQRLVMFGDVFTSPIQISYPHLTTANDDLPALSQATAIRLLDELDRPDTLGFGIHFSDQQFGTVIRTQDHTQWQRR